MSRISKTRRWATALAVIALAAAGAGWWFLGRDVSAAKPVYRLVKVERGTIANTVTASGTLRALVTVDVGTQISGQIKQLFADFNTEVKAGQVIAQLDPATFEAKVQESEADLAVAKANVVMQRSRLDSMEADTRQAQSAMAQAKLDLDRKKELLPSRAIAQSQYDLAVSTYEQGVAKHQGMIAKEGEQRAQIAVAMAQVDQKEATLRQRRIDLENTQIRSPVDGIVIARNVDVGQTVAASLQSPVLFTIAQDLKRMQVEVNVDEADIGRIRDGLPVTFTVDSFPGRQFGGAVRQMRKAPKEVASVITYTVVVGTENPDLRLLPGMTANVVFQIDRRENALVVPNAALRFRPGETPQPRATTASAPEGRANPQARIEDEITSLKRELTLTAEQEERVRAVFREIGQRMQQLRESGTAAEDLREEMAKSRRAADEKIAAMLTPEQRAKYDELRASAGADGTRRATVYVAGPDGEPKPVRIVAGVSDGANTEVVGGELKLGDQVMVGLDNRNRLAGGANAGRRFGF